MTDKAPETQWWIARDGQQHGPLSDDEMRAFIEMRHLRATDLVWRPGFVDWRPAQLIFPMQAHYAAPDNLHDMVGAPVMTEPAGLEAETTEAGFEFEVEAPREEIRAARATRDGAAGRAHSGQTGEAAPRREIRRRPEPGEALPIAKIAGFAAAAFLVLGGGWFVLANGPSLNGLAGLFSTVTGSLAEDTTPETLDARLQRMALWVAVKKQFPNWYGDLVRETAKLSGDDPKGAAMTKHLAESLVDLRRQNANAALSASPARLRGIAEAFLENLRSLKAQSTEACYAFISQGETSPATIGLLESPRDGRPMQNQVAAIVAAIAEGRATPITREKPTKTDYDALAAALTKIGWKEDDLRLFANPKALASSTPERVCQMVQDWFRVHIEIEDQPMQERLLVETLRPVVAG